MYMSGSDCKMALFSFRYELFCIKASETNIPPALDCLKQHVQRANYQAAIWRRAHVSCINPPDPTLHGWTEQAGCLSIKWMNGPYAPPEVAKVVSCSCKKTYCSSKKCLCNSQNLPCTDMCKCGEDCTNHQALVPEIDSDGISDSDED